MRPLLLFAFGLALLAGCGKADPEPVKVQDLRKRGKPVEVIK
jgi:hypothetical protein